MTNPISTPTIGEILQKEFMEPFNLSADALAKAIDVPLSHLEKIAAGNEPLFQAVAIRLAKFFGVSEHYFLNLQNDIAARNERQQLHSKTV